MTRKNLRPAKGPASCAGNDQADGPGLKPRAYSIPDVCKLTGLSRSTIYQAIKEGHLVAGKYGRRTFVLAEDLETFLQQSRRVREVRTSDKPVDGARN